MSRFSRLVGVLAVAAVAATPALASTPTVATSAAAPADVATDLRIPWSAAVLPDGRILVTERNTARILSVSPTGQVDEVQQLSEVRPGGEGGLLGIAVSPDFAADGLVYVYYTAATDNRIARMRLGEPPQPVRTGIPKAGNHNGGRIAFGPDGMLYAGTGDAGNTGNSQNVGSLGGKILRMTPDGDPAPGNPFPNSVVWSLGHRNVQGLAWDDAGRLYASEFGQNRFDELNRITAGANYGWPIVEGMGNDARFVNPLAVWPPAQASPSGIGIRGSDVYVACLRGTKLFRVRLNPDGGVEGQPEALFDGEFGRLRHVLVEPGGALLVLTSNTDGRGDPRPGDDRIVRLDI